MQEAALAARDARDSNYNECGQKRAFSISRVPRVSWTENKILNKIDDFPWRPNENSLRNCLEYKMRTRVGPTLHHFSFLSNTRFRIGKKIFVRSARFINVNEATSEDYSIKIRRTGERENGWKLNGRLSKGMLVPGRVTRRRTRSDLYLIKITRWWERARHASQDIRGRLHAQPGRFET